MSLIKRRNITLKYICTQYMKTYVGCCSKTVPWDKYAKIFDAVEINSTFYKLPEEETVRRW
jgi:uncharacterized protein YecE (DUF72 family)